MGLIAPQQLSLPFAEEALAPAISAKTVLLHYGKHHKTYFDKLNALIIGTNYADIELKAIMVEAAKSETDTPILNNAAQAWNHVVYWEQFKPARVTCWDQTPSSMGIISEEDNNEYGRHGDQ